VASALTTDDPIPVPFLRDEIIGMAPYVIAEPASTHEKSHDHCLSHIREAAKAGASAMKFQWLSSAMALAQKRHAPDYVEAYQKIAFPYEWHKDLAEYTRKNNMAYGCSIYLHSDVEPIAPFVDFFKVSSFEASDIALIEWMGIFGKPIYVSLGMRDDRQCRSMIRQVMRSDIEVPVYFLYCTTGYPVPVEELNLAVLTSWIYHGYSDHSADPTVGARAYAAGARVFEVHTRLEQTPQTNADYAVSLTYREFQAYIHAIHEQRTYFGSNTRTIQPIEDQFKKYKR